MSYFETPQQVFDLTGLHQPDDGSVPYAPSYYEAAQPPLTSMDFPTAHSYAEAPSQTASDTGEGYGLDLNGYASHPDLTDMDVRFTWAEPIASVSETEDGPEYLGSTGVDYTFTGPVTPEQAMKDFRDWTAAHPDSTPADPLHRERLAALYDTLDPNGHVAAASAAKAARKTTETATGPVTAPETDPTKTTVIRVADVVGGVAAQHTFVVGETTIPLRTYSDPETGRQVSPPQPQPSGRHAAGRGRHRRS